MVQSLNTKVDLTVNATSFLGMSTYGKILLGDRGFEFYNDRKVEDYIQIPWEEIDKVIVSLVFGGRWIPRYAIQTKQSGTYSFASKQPHHVLRIIRSHIGPENVVRSLSFFDIIKRGFKRIFRKKKK